MSIPNLPVNFKDDILAASNPKRKYQQTFNSDGSVSLEDVTVYTQKGSDFGASQVNQTNGAVNNIYDERILTLDELELVTEPGFFVDAQAAKEAYDTLNSNKASVEIIEDSGSFHNIRIGNLQIISGSIIPLSQGEYVQLFTLAQLKQYFGNDFALNRFEITTRNGDATSANVHFYEPEYWPGNQAFYQYYYPSRGTGFGVQVHYTMTYIHPAT